MGRKCNRVFFGSKRKEWRQREACLPHWEALRHRNEAEGVRGDITRGTIKMLE